VYTVIAKMERRHSGPRPKYGEANFNKNVQEEGARPSTPHILLHDSDDKKEN
jgi:hypothetical protein